MLNIKPSPICLVNSQNTLNGVDVTAGQTIVIQLQDHTGVDSWSCYCVSTDELQNKNTINDSIIIDNLNKTATFTFPTETTGASLIFNSIVNQGIYNNIRNNDLTSRFKICSLSNITNQRVMAVNETTEGNNEFGWITTTNYPIRFGGGGSGGNQDLNSVLSYGNTTDGYDLIVSTGDKITLTDAPTISTDAVNKAYVDGYALGYGTVAGGDLSGTYPDPTIDTNAVTFTKIQQISTDKLLGRDTASTGNVEELSVSGGLEFTGSGGIQRSAISGDVTIAAGATTATVTDLTITSEAQGDILYRNASNWVRLPASTEGYVLTTHNTGNNPTWAPPVSTEFHGFFSSGYDGNLTSSSGITTLSKATYYDGVTLTGTAQINTNGWPLYIKTFNASNAPTRAIYAKGLDTAATSPNPPAATTPQTGSYLGGNGTGGQAPSAGANPNLNGDPGSAGATLAIAGGGIGGVGGTGGNGNGGKLGGAGGAGGVITLRIYSQGVHPIAPVYTGPSGPGIYPVIYGGSGGGGGGSGAGSNGINGGAAGTAGPAGGPVMEVYIDELITGASTPSVLIDSYGGATAVTNGTPSGGGAGASGGGGGGGITRVFIGKRTGSPISNLICANGSDGGTNGPAAGGGTTGTGGQAGGGGEVYVVVQTTGETFYKGYEVGGGPVGSPSGTGGVHTTWGVTV